MQAFPSLILIYHEKCTIPLYEKGALKHYIIWKCPLFRVSFILIQGILIQSALYLGHPLFRVSFIQGILYSECPLFRVSFIQSILYSGYPLFRVSFIQGILYPECPLFRVSFIQKFHCDCIGPKSPHSLVQGQFWRPWLEKNHQRQACLFQTMSYPSAGMSVKK